MNHLTILGALSKSFEFFVYFIGNVLIPFVAFSLIRRDGVPQGHVRTRFIFMINGKSSKVFYFKCLILLKCFNTLCSLSGGAFLGAISSNS